MSASRISPAHAFNHTEQPDGLEALSFQASSILDVIARTGRQTLLSPGG